MSRSQGAFPGSSWLLLGSSWLLLGGLPSWTATDEKLPYGSFSWAPSGNETLQLLIRPKRSQDADKWESGQGSLPSQDQSLVSFFLAVFSDQFLPAVFGLFFPAVFRGRFFRQFFPVVFFRPVFSLVVLYWISA